MISKLIRLWAIAPFLFLPFTGHSQCTSTNATSCVCPPGGGTNCDLLPDITVAKLPLNQTSNYTEYPQVCNPPCSGNDGRLRIGVSTPITGYGPLESRGTSKYVCGTDTIDAGSVGNIPATCPVTGLPPKQLINQRIYHKTNSVMSFYDRPAGTMTYHPTHGHQHVDEWGVYTLRSNNGDLNPLNWPIIGTGAKLGFCLIDIGQCNSSPGYCTDSAGNTLNSTNIPNYGLNGLTSGTYSCNNSLQGITNGWMDTYSQGLDGMWINIPPGICNGTYWVVVSIDPNNNFLETNENNNVVAVPLNITKQGGGSPVVTVSGPTTFCPGGSVMLTASTAPNYSWSNGAKTQSITVTTPGSYFVTTDTLSSCSGTSAPITVSFNSVNISPLSADICPGDSVQLIASNSFAQSTTFSAGTGVLTNSATTYPAPYGNWYWGSRHQFIIRASELTAAGLNAGVIDGLAFDVSSVNSAPVHNGFTIKMGNTTLDTIGTFQAGLTSVKLPVNYQPVAGWNTHSFETPFTWNGASNIIVEVCFQNTSYVNNGNASVRQSSTAYRSSVYYRADATGVCGNNLVTGTFFQRPNIRFSRAIPATYSWSPPAGLSNASISNPYAKPLSTTTYTVTSTCGATGARMVSIATLPVNISSDASAMNCSGDTIQLSSSVIPTTTQNAQFTFINKQPLAIPDFPAEAVNSLITVSGISPATLGSNSIVSVGLNLTHTYDGDLTLSLVSPSGSSIFLSNRRGAGGNDFTNTVFSMSATTLISAGVAPFTGSFVPDGNFSSLTGNANGSWQLRAQDMAGVDTGMIVSWNITINNVVPETFNYLWSSVPPGFSSTQQNPVVFPITSATYSVSISSNATTCTGTNNTSVNVAPPISITNCTPMAGAPGAIVTIQGSNFMNVASVLLAGIPASSFTVINANQIQATVPQAASQTGPVRVINSNGCSGTFITNFTISQPVNLTLKVFIEGLYEGNGLMIPMLYSNSLSADPNATDSITVELRQATDPFNLAATAKGIVNKNGNVSLVFPSSVFNNSYFLVLRYRNAIETWSKNTLFINSESVSFDFTTP